RAGRAEPRVRAVHPLGPRGQQDVAIPPAASGLSPAPGRESDRRGLPVGSPQSPGGRSSEPDDAVADFVRVPVDESVRRSTHAGLWLLVAPLVRLGLPAWLERNPVLSDAGFAARLLSYVADVTGASVHDPARGGTLGGEDLPWTTPGTWMAPGRWRGLCRRG